MNVLKVFLDETLDNLILSNHGASAQGQSWFGFYDKTHVDNDEEGTSTNEIRNYLKRSPDAPMTTSNREVKMFQDIGNKVRKGEDLSLAF